LILLSEICRAANRGQDRPLRPDYARGTNQQD
jgi:hypothetical protein